MKKILTLFLCATILSFVSCEDEPLEGDFVTGGITCEQATINTAEAALNFLGVNDDNYQQLCVAYKNALDDQIQACGDPDGTLEAAVNALGDCSTTVVNDCDSATDAVDAAQLAFANASDEEYTNLCNAYKATLENQITQCGDDDGSIQSTIDDLGDCTQATLEVEISLTAGTLPIDFDIVDVVIDGDLLKVTGETSAANNYTIYFEVGQGQTGVDVINPAFELTLTSVFFPSTQGFDDFTSEITVNTDGTLTGTFWGIVTNADGGDLSLTSGMINITY
ncbi:hypothetical protein [Psychroserpens sp. SPM9]|uniref:hypothetical protein n=1 Tax=Psychroserpens sp. SPM9 TaxID=2975598 RepID=UPI0021A8022E|nr:hypothetical protein [Psychroserpens sp. SPM9]MDG5491431.1 hypothetical protein [Psychroserpens sp. SPM9]